MLLTSADNAWVSCSLGSEAAKPKVRAGVLHDIQHVLRASGLGCGTLVSEVDSLQGRTIRIHQDCEYQQRVKDQHSSKKYTKCNSNRRKRSNGLKQDGSNGFLGAGRQLGSTSLKKDCKHKTSVNTVNRRPSENV